MLKIVCVKFPEQLNTEEAIILQEAIYLNSNYLPDSNSFANSINIFSFSGDIPHCSPLLYYKMDI